MAFIAKLAKQPLKVGDRIECEAPSFYGGHDIRAGEVLYIWEDESSGGAGLAMKATVITAHSERKIVALSGRIDGVVKYSLSNDALAEHRGGTSDVALSGLSRKLYAHAHLKVARLTPEEAEKLEYYFTEN